MSTETRTYSDFTKAKEAMDELFANGFKEVQASFRPDRVRVALDPPFGEGEKAARILESHGPLSGADAEWANEGVAPAAGGLASKIEDPAAPLSNLLGWRVLTNAKSPFWPEKLLDDPAPLSNRMGWPVLLAENRGGARRPPAAPPDSPQKAPEGSARTEAGQAETPNDHPSSGPVER